MSTTSLDRPKARTLDAVRLELAQLHVEVEYRRCRESFFHFAENYCYIDTRDQGHVLFNMFDAQRSIVTTLDDYDKVICLKARQIGWSTIVSLYSLWEILFCPPVESRLIVFLSRNETEAEKLLAKAVFAYRRLPEWLASRCPKRTDNTKKRMTFDNDCVIEAMPSKKDPARGSTAYRIVLDEAAFFEDLRNAYASVEAAADVGGRITILSTANGYDHFQEMWQKACLDENAFQPIFLPWSARPDRDQAWYDAKVAELEEWLLHQEYPSSPEVAFRKSGRPVFDSDALSSFEKHPGEKYHLTIIHGRQAELYPGGDLELYERPEPGNRYAIGGDTAQGLEHGDYAAAHIVKVGGLVNGKVQLTEVVGVLHAKLEPDVFAQHLYDLGTWYYGAKICVESNFHGQTTLTTLHKRLRYSNLFYQRIERAERVDKRTKRLGFWTSGFSKAPLIDDLSTLIRNREIIINHPRTIAELLSYIRDGQSFRGQPHDDLVMSLAMAMVCAREVHITEPVVPTQHGQWTVDYVLEQMDRAEGRGPNRGVVRPTQSPRRLSAGRPSRNPRGLR